MRSLMASVCFLGTFGIAAHAADPIPDTKTDKSKSFELQGSTSARKAKGATASRIKATRTEAAMKFVVVDKDKGPVKGLVISLTAPDGNKFYTEETDDTGYAEVLVPVGQKYDLVYLSLGRRDISTSVTVTPESNQNIKLTLRYKGLPPPLPLPDGETPGAPRFVLNGVNFDTAKATIRPESFPRLDSVVEFMAHKKTSRIEISGHTDNVGKPKANKTLSENRARSCRDYLISKGIAGDRITAVGFGGERPMAPNTTDDGRQQNRRIEAKEI